MTVVILAGGDGTRWGGYLGVPKHLVPIDGEPLLARTVRLLRERVPEREIVVVGPYDVGCRRVEPVSSFWPVAALAAARTVGPTVALLGDVLFSGPALDAICGGSGLCWYGRYGGSEIKAHGELFAVRFRWGDDGERLRRAADLATRFCAPSPPLGWHVYRLCDSIPFNVHAIGPLFHEINDGTDDFDIPVAYDRWLALRGTG